MSSASLCLLALVAQEPTPPSGPAPAPPASATPSADAAAAAAEVDLTTSSEAEHGVEERAPVRLYGFADVGLQKMILGDASALTRIVPTRATTFVLGNLNVYLDAQPSPNWRALVELRLTRFPHNTRPTCPSTDCPPYITEQFDPSSPSPYSRLKWSGIVLERAYIDWQRSDLLTLRAGYFLTPFGVWNIDHGTPTLISLMLPLFEVNEFFPLQQLGVEAFGTLPLGGWQLGYFAYVSNGRSENMFDYTEDKMLGGRLVLRRQVPWALAFGMSGLYGRYVERTEVVQSFLSSLAVMRRDVVDYKEVVGGADVSLDVGDLRLRAEAAIRRMDFATGKRLSFYRVQGLYFPDRLEWDGYVLGAYQLPWFGLEPFAFLELYRYPTPLSEGALSVSAGLNIHFTSFAQLKTQVLRGTFLNLSDETTSVQSDQNFWTLATRLVLAF